MSLHTNRLKKRMLRPLAAVVALSLLLCPYASAQEAIWSSYNQDGVKFFEGKEYDKAEKLLIEAVKEAEKLPPEDAQKLLQSLRVLRKVYLAMGKGSQAAQIESRLRSLGDMTSGSSSSSGPTEDPASDPSSAKYREDRVATTFKQSTPEPAHNEDSKAVYRDNTPDTSKTTEKEFTISTQYRTDAPTETSVEDSEKPIIEPRKLASAAGFAGLYGGSKKAIEVVRMVGHAGWIKALDFSSDGNKVLSSSQDNSIRLWNPNSGKEIGKFEGHEDDVNCVIFSPSGSNALSGGSDKTVRLWDIDQGTELKKFEGHTNLVTCVAFSESGSRVASGSYDGTVRIWDTSTGKQVKQLEGNLGTVRALAFTPDGDQIVSGGTDKTVTLWNINTGAVVRKFSGHKNEISSLAISQDGNKILSSSRDLTIQLWDLSTGEPLKLLQGHTNWIQKAIFLGSDKAISGGLDKKIRLWDLNTAKEIDSYQISSVGMWSVAFNPKGDQIVTGSDDFSIRLWRLP
ncbi:MAG: hypothetical protein SGJ27_20900 [Candidatus Melainabacteria bacterium]|nr:hypothetical protein [Candidatus Melainabacteria bacterium]